MNGISRKIRLAGCAIVLLAGCRNVQYPSFGWSRSTAGEQIAADRQAMVYHDPEPDTEAGPWVERPRGFERPRAAPRRVDERYEITQELNKRDGAPSTTNPSASRYPNSVTP